MNRKGLRIAVAAAICCGLVAVLSFAVARAVFPVGPDSLCGAFHSDRGGSIKFEQGYSFVVEDAIFLSGGDGSVERVSGSGQLDLDQDIDHDQVSLSIREAEVVLDLNLGRSWEGRPLLWHWIDDPDIGERETFVRRSAC
ncbi:hypothetical protein ACN27B_20160 [Micromonospora sp. WMMD754]|uniref:hypothetical protein n=1 Tax=Micromonospora sp. WMMD754 TaxID=3404114 RepID=UPI003BF51788